MVMMTVMAGFVVVVMPARRKKQSAYYIDEKSYCRDKERLVKNNYLRIKQPAYGFICHV